MRVFVDRWSGGEPLGVGDGDPEGAAGELLEERAGESTLAAVTAPSVADARPLSFLDGVRRVDVPLQALQDDGRIVFGMAGTHAQGAVRVADGQALPLALEVTRLVVWGSGAMIALQDPEGRLEWTVVSITADGPDAPRQELQARMRQAEAVLAERLSADGMLVVCDGPLNYGLRRDPHVVGYVKTHHRSLLPPELHRLVPTLQAGQRSPLFALTERYSCYLRVGPRPDGASPWRGIVRLELAQSAGLDAARQVADSLAARLGPFGSHAVKDPRAPVNLKPIGWLEQTLKRRMGHHKLVARAISDAALTTQGDQAA